MLLVVAGFYFLWLVCWCAVVVYGYLCWLWVCFGVVCLERCRYIRCMGLGLFIAIVFVFVIVLLGVLLPVGVLCVGVWLVGLVWLCECVYDGCFVGVCVLRAVCLFEGLLDFGLYGFGLLWSLSW